MSSVIVVFPKIEDAKNIRNLLVRHGISVMAVCTTGSQALNYADAAGGGLVICGYRFPDMLYSDLRQTLPEQFEMLLLASQRILVQKEPDDVMCVAMPLKVHELLDTINMMQHRLARRKKKKRERAKGRDPKEKAIIDKAKKLLMERNHMTEEEAHRYVQKCSMDSGNNMVETAEMIMSIMNA